MYIVPTYLVVDYQLDLRASWSPMKTENYYFYFYFHLQISEAKVKN